MYYFMRPGLRPLNQGNHRSYLFLKRGVELILIPVVGGRTSPYSINITRSGFQQQKYRATSFLFAKTNSNEAVGNQRAEARPLWRLCLAILDVKFNSEVLCGEVGFPTTGIFNNSTTLSQRQIAMR